MGKTASARKRKGPSFAFPNCVSKKLKDDELRRTSVFKRLLDEHVLVFTWSEIVLLFISFHFFFLKERKKRNGLLVVTRTLSSTERQKTSNEVVSLRISLLPFIIIIISSTSVSLVPFPLKYF